MDTSGHQAEASYALPSTTDALSSSNSDIAKDASMLPGAPLASPSATSASAAVNDGSDTKDTAATANKKKGKHSRKEPRAPGQGKTSRSTKKVGGRKVKVPASGGLEEVMHHEAVELLGADLCAAAQADESEYRQRFQYLSEIELEVIAMSSHGGSPGRKKKAVVADAVLE